jgi:TonB family protein
MLALLVLAPSLASAVTLSAPSTPPSPRSSRNAEFLQKNYPPVALARGEQGRVAFEITVEPDGFLSSCVITKSSGFPNLDRETCDFLVKYARPNPARSAEGRAVQVTQQGHIDWKLPAGVRQLASAKATTPFDSNKLICRKYLKAGSKIAYVKQCMTRAQWTIQEDSLRDQLRTMQESRTCGRLNC